MRAQPRFGDHVDFSSQEILQIHQQGAKVEQASPWLDDNQEIDVAVGTCITACNRSKDSHVLRAAPH